MIKTLLLRCALAACFAAFAFPSAFSQSVTVSPTSISFGNQAQGTSSSVHNVTLKNGQKSAITVNSIVTSLADYTETNNCPVSPATLAPAGTCTISVTFTPSAQGSRNATLTIVDTGLSSPQLVTLTGTGTSPVLESIALTPSTASIIAADAEQFTATGTYSDGSTQNLTTTASWTSSSATVATIGLHTGLAKGVAAGTATITATSGKISGLATLTVTAPVLTSISVSPSTASVAAGKTQQFTATGTYNNGTTQNLTNSVTWSSSATSIATVSSGGLATSIAQGSAAITATSGTISGSATLTVTTAVLTSISVTPATASVPAGYTEQFTATGTYSNGTTQNLTTTATWTSTKISVATVSTSGLATSVAAGTTTIKATSGAISGSATLTVTAAVLTSISVTPSTASVAAGYTEQFTATGNYSNGTTQNLTASASWISSNTSVATVKLHTGLATSVAQGTATITATSGTISGSATLTVTAAVLTSISLTPATASVAAGNTEQFTATGTYSNGTTQNLTTSATWTSSKTSVATVNGGGLATGVAQGTATITATSGSIRGSATLTVTAAVLTSISVTPATASIPAGDTQQFTATGTYSNGTTQSLTATWTSSNPSVASISGTGLATAVAQGSATITATSGAISGTASLTVTGPALTSISITPANPSIPNGTTQQFTATGNYSDGSTQNLTSSVAWSSSPTSVATIAAGGLATGVSVGTATITATSGSITASTTLGVGQPTLVSIAVTPANSSFALGTTLPLTATGTYSDGSTLNITTTVTWSSANPGVATVSNQGIASSLALGSTSVTATSGAITGSTTVTVTAAVLVSIAVTPAIPTLPLGTTQQFTATGTYTDGSTQNITDTVQWSSGTPAVATISDAGTTTGLATTITEGTATISATSATVSGSTTLTVTAAGLVSIAVTPTSPAIALGTTQQFTATGTYTDGSTQNLTSTVTWSSDTSTTATINTSGAMIGLATSVGQGTATISATSGAISGSTLLTVTAAALVSITINPPTATISLGTTQQFTATGTYTDGSTQNLTQSGQWSSSVATVATISNTAATAGLATSLGVGTTTIGFSSGTISATATLVVNPAALVSIAINPQNAAIALGTTQQFTATGTYTDGGTQDVTSTVTWSSSDATIAIISNAVGSYGLATSSGQGTAAISATSGTISSSTTLTVSGPALLSIAVTPSSVSIPLGVPQQFTATGTYTDGSTQNLTASATWTSSSPAVASVSATGLATGNRLGTTNISATSGTVTGSSSLSVIAPVLVSIAVAPNPASIAAGDTQQFTATGTYSDGTMQTLIATWSSSNTSVATIGGTGLAAAVAQGSATITATSGTISGTASLTVTAPTLTSISITPANASIPNGTTQQFTANGTYSDGSTQNLTSSVTWSSSATSVATIAAGGLATGVSVGTATITATSGSITASTTLAVGQPVLVSIAVTPANSSFALGTTLLLTATGTYSDGSTLNLTTSVTWSSANPGVATVSTQGVASSVALGTATVTATSGAIAGSTTVTVTAAVLVSIAVTPAIPALPVGTTQQFTATGTYTDGSTQNITDTVQWSSDTPAVATISDAGTTIGLATTVTKGTATITATSGTVSGSTTLTVTAAALVSIAVTPETPSIALGTTQQFAAIGTYTDGSTQNLTTTVTWSSDTPATATISTTGATIGLATSVGQGTATISATSGTISGSTLLTVTAAALVSIAINPPTATISLGTTQQFTATGTFTDGTTQNLTQSGQWSSTVATVATISNTAATAGLATSLGTGTTSIGISSGTISASATLVVNPAALVSITINPQNPAIALGTTQQFTATGTYTDGSTQDLTTVVTWNSSDATIAIISNAVGSYGLATSAGQGTTTISAASNTITSSTALTVSGPALVSIAVTPASISIALGYTEQFAAMGTYSDGSTQDLTQSATWTSSAPAVALVSSTGYATSVYPGTATISASSEAVTGGAVLTVSGAVAISLVITPSSPSVVVGAQEQFTATLNYSDGSSLNVTSSVTWTSSNLAVATISVGGLATGVGAGSSTIEASYGTSSPITGTTMLNVQTGVAVSPAVATIAISGTQQFTATVSVSGNPSVTWSVDGIPGGSNTTGIGTITSAGLYTASPATGTHTITATAGSSSGSAMLTIVSASGAVPATPYFGIDYNKGTPFGASAISHGIGRFWDTPSAEWPFLQTSACTTSPCPNSFSWVGVDTLLSQMYSNSVWTAQAGLGRTPSFATSNPTDGKCNYAKQGGTGNNSPGQCDPPSDLNSDGTGADQYWRDWVAAYASHVNGPGYTNTHARIAYWEIWNEPDSTAFWTGTFNQLIRMQEDAYCIIKGGSFTIRATGETCTQVQGTVRSVPMSGPIDTTAMIVMPSYHTAASGTTSVTQAQAFLYCTGPNAGSYCTNGGHATTDALNFHTKPGANYPTPLESVMNTWTMAIGQILQPAELAKPLFDSEGGYAASGWIAPYTVDLNQAAYIARFFIYTYYKGYANNVWYYYNSSTNGLGSAAADTAYSQVYAGMVGATGLSCSANPNGTGDAAQPSLYICTFNEPDGTAAQWMWDADNTGEPAFWDTGAPNNLECDSGVCPTHTQNVPANMLSYVSISGVAVSIVNNQVPVGIQPILVQAKP